MIEMIAGFCKRISRYVSWVGRKIYQIIAAFLVFVLIGADGLMHALGIPHIEGWWVTLAGGLIAASGIGVWIKKHKKFHTCTHEHKHQHEHE